jgi:FdhD protein
MAVSTFISGVISRASGAKITRDEDRMAIEEPLEIRLGRSPIAITMRTPGNDVELAVGFLLTEGVIQGAGDITQTVAPDRKQPNVIAVKLKRGLRFDRDRLNRYFHTTSSCGLCGKTTLDAINVKTKSVSSDLKISPKLLYSLPAKLREEQETFDETGGLHGAALFDANGKLQFVREDVGRHNAVDKAIGAALLQGQFPLDQNVLLVSGRASFEILQKALVARIPIVAAVSAPSSLAVALARKFKMTLVGFLRGESCNIYAGAERIGS